MRQEITITPDDWRDARGAGYADTRSCLVATAIKRVVAPGVNVCIGTRDGFLHDRQHWVANFDLPPRVTKQISRWMMAPRWRWFYALVPKPRVTFAIDVPEYMLRATAESAFLASCRSLIDPPRVPVEE